jgi:hypothetical protein
VQSESKSGQVSAGGWPSGAKDGEMGPAPPARQVSGKNGGTLITKPVHLKLLRNGCAGFYS